MTAARPGAGHRQRGGWNASRCFLQTVGVLVLFTVARAAGWLGPPGYVWVPVSLLTAVLALVAWTAGATRADLGLDRTDVRAGLRYGAGAFGIVLLVLVVAAVIPATNGFLHDSRAQISGGRMLYELGGVDPAADGDPGGVRVPRRPAGVGAAGYGGHGARA